VNDVIAYAELKPWFSAAVGILGLAGIVVGARSLRRRPAWAALGLIVSSATAITCLLEAWSIADNPPTHVSTFGGCAFFMLIAEAGATAALMLLCTARRR
jgi:hypothetical protein